MLSKAIRIASVAFEGKYDKSGVPYIMHCLHVMYGVEHLGDRYMIVAVLHDLIEDTDWTLEMLLEEGFDIETVTAIGCLTHLKDESYDDYIKRCAGNVIAKEIKKKDLEHNSDITRLKGLRQKDHDRIEKYHRSYVYLSD